jgi:hypothetical protein
MYDNLERTFIKAEGKNLKKGIIEGGGAKNRYHELVPVIHLSYAS